MEKQFWREKTVLVTGCTGFLGFWLTTLLLRFGARVIGIIRDRTPKGNFYLSKLDDEIDIVNGTICDLGCVQRTISDYRVDTIFHLAAQAIVQVATESPVSTFETNIVGTWNLLEATRLARRVKRFVLASSPKVYGDQAGSPIKEDSRLLAVFPYEVSKVCQELLTRSYFQTYFESDNPHVLLGITRCANLFGGGDMSSTRVIPRQLRRAMRRDYLQYNLCVRQFLYVLDAARAYIMLAEKLDDPSINGRPFNFAGETISIRDLVRDKIRGICGSWKNLEVRQLLYLQDGRSDCIEENTDKPAGYKEYPPKEIKEECMSSENANKLLGWVPTYSLEQGLQDTFYWYDSWFNNNNIKQVNDDLLERFIEISQQRRPLTTETGKVAAYR